MNAWIYLALGIVFEVAGTSALKLSQGFTQTVPALVCLLCFGTALYFLSQSVKSLDLGVVYAIWCGVGIVLISLIGVIVFGDNLTFAKLAFISLIVIGVVGLQLSSGDAITQQNAADASKGNLRNATPQNAAAEKSRVDR